MGRSKTLQMSEATEWFSGEIEKAGRKVRKYYAEKYVNLGEVNEVYLLGEIISTFQGLASASNDSQSRSEVIYNAAAVAYLCQKLAEIEREGDDGDVRQMFQDD